jgi:pilus assembly protein CpaB
MASASVRSSAIARREDVMLQGKYPLLIALVLGLFAGVIAYSAIHARTKAQADYWATARVLCAQSDLEEGTALDDDLIDICETPSRFITDSYIRVPAEEAKESLVPYGQKIIIPLKKGDPILVSEFESRNEFPLAETVPRAGRAVSVEVSEKSAVNQLIRPNDHVDVVASLREPDGRDPIAVTLLENVIVLATGRTTGQNFQQPEEEKRYTHVVLLAFPEEAEMLVLAQDVGTLSLTLRNPDDSVTGKSNGTKTTVTSLLTREKEIIALRMDKLQPTHRLNGGYDDCSGRGPCRHLPFDPGETSGPHSVH